MTLAIGVDVGGTKVAAGVVDEDGQIVAKLKRSTPAASPARTEQAIADAVTELLGDHDVAAIGLGAAGFVDSARATMLFAPNLAWRDEPLKQRVEERLGREVVVENDANASAWAEARFGAARGYRDVMLVALGTGIGAAILIGGELYRGQWGIAGEPGHVRGTRRGRRNRGCRRPSQSSQSGAGSSGHARFCSGSSDQGRSDPGSSDQGWSGRRRSDPRLDHCSDHCTVVSIVRAARPGVVHPQYQYGEPGHERGDRQERGDARYRPVRRGRRDQVSRPAEQRYPGSLGDRVQLGQRRWRGRDVMLVVVFPGRLRWCLARPDLARPGPVRPAPVRRRPPVPPRGLDHVRFVRPGEPVCAERPAHALVVEPAYPLGSARLPRGPVPRGLPSVAGLVRRASRTPGFP
jgi:hypothetical protein